MKKLSLILLAFLTSNVFAQKIYFPKSSYSDSMALDANIPLLAKEVIKHYRDADKINYFENLFRLCMAAGEFKEAISNLDTLRKYYGVSDPEQVKGVGFQFQTYSEARIRQRSSRMPLKDIYISVFDELYLKLPNSAATTVGSYFTADVVGMKKSLNKTLSGFEGKDSISVDEARSICRIYNSYRTYAFAQELALREIKKFENQTYIIQDSILIKMRDGSSVSAIVVRLRKEKKKLPAIFVFNIYNSRYDIEKAKEAAIKGYVGVVANTRGKKNSPQNIEPFEHDASDAYDIINWISKQSWCNGKVGMYGGSYLGFSQWAATKKLHPALKTIVPQVAVGIGIDYPMHNNVFMSYMLRWIHFVTNSKETDNVDFGNEEHWNRTFAKWYASGRSFKSLDSLEGRPSAIFQRWLQHPAYDTYWKNMVPYQNEFSNINIPILTTTGYFDDDQLGAMYYFKEHHKYNKNAEHYLLIGPYDHPGAQGIPASEFGKYTIDSVANISIDKVMYEWFDFILKKAPKPSMLKDKINYQVMGTNTWKHVPSLSKMNSDTIVFYLSNIRNSEHYKLSNKPTAVSEFIRQEINLKDRSDSLKLMDINVLKSKLDMNNFISFSTEVFGKDLEINGSFVAELTASCNKKDMDIAVEIYEQMADGSFFKLSNALVRASYAKDRSQRQLLVPGKMETIPVNNTFFTSRKISAGSKIVVLIGVNKSPDWQINYGSGKEVSDENMNDAGDDLQIQWYNTSWIRIPVNKK